MRCAIIQLDLSRDMETVRIVDVRSSLEAGNPELQVVFNRDQLAALHLDLGTMSATLQDRVQGAVPTRYKEADRQIDVRIRNREADRRSAADVENLVCYPARMARPFAPFRSRT